MPRQERSGAREPHILMSSMVFRAGVATCRRGRAAFCCLTGPHEYTMMDWMERSIQFYLWTAIDGSRIRLAPSPDNRVPLVAVAHLAGESVPRIRRITVNRCSAMRRGARS